DGIGEIDYPNKFFVAWFGVCLIFLGVWLRLYAMRINRFFSRNLRIGEGQFIVTEGPYRHIRHPGYLGQLLIWNGFGLSSGNYLVASIIFIVISLTYWFRIRKEEVSLLRTFGVDYLEYSTRVSKLIPHIY
ncbi:16114_t:CDS:2, partial [Funneliformis geosporum]